MNKSIKYFSLTLATLYANIAMADGYLLPPPPSPWFIGGTAGGAWPNSMTISRENHFFDHDGHGGGGHGGGGHGGGGHDHGGHDHDGHDHDGHDHDGHDHAAEGSDVPTFANNANTSIGDILDGLFNTLFENNGIKGKSSGNAGVALSVMGGYKWLNPSEWLPGFALAVRYQHFFPQGFSGTISPRYLLGYTTSSYTWDFSSDVVSLYSKIDLIQYGRFIPFVGLGVGAAMNQANNYNQTIFPEITSEINVRFRNHTQTNVAFNAGVGFDYAILPHVSLSLAYEYQYLGPVKTGNGIDFWTGQRMNLGSYSANMLTGGIVYYFG